MHSNDDDKENFHYVYTPTNISYACENDSAVLRLAQTHILFLQNCSFLAHICKIVEHMLVYIVVCILLAVSLSKLS